MNMPIKQEAEEEKFGGVTSRTVVGKRSRDEYDSEGNTDTESDDENRIYSPPSPEASLYLAPIPKRVRSLEFQHSILAIIRDCKNSRVSLQWKTSTASGKLKEEGRSGEYRWFSYHGCLENSHSLEIQLKAPRRFLSVFNYTTPLRVFGSNGYHFACHTLSGSKGCRDKYGNQLFEWIQKREDYQDVKFAVMETVAMWMKEHSQTSYPNLEINDLFDCANLDRVDWPLLMYLMSQVLMVFDCKDVVYIYPRNQVHYENTLLYLLSEKFEKNESLAKLLAKSADSSSPLECLLAFLTLRWIDNAPDISTQLYHRIISKFGFHEDMNEHPRQNKGMLVPKNHPYRQELLQCNTTTLVGGPEEWV